MFADTIGLGVASLADMTAHEVSTERTVSKLELADDIHARREATG